MSLQVEPIKDPSKLEIRQSRSPHLPKLPMRSLFLANSSGREDDPDRESAAEQEGVP